MRGLEPGLFLLALLAVPALGWSIGRAMGRRDVRIGFVLVGGCLAALIPNLIRIAVIANAAPPDFATAFIQQVTRTLDSPEVGLFFVALGVFMTMLGWTATPSQPGKLNSDAPPLQR